jgi:hypothetical protein
MPEGRCPHRALSAEVLRFLLSWRCTSNPTDPVISPGASTSILFDGNQSSLELEQHQTATRQWHRVQLRYELITALLCVVLKFKEDDVCVLRMWQALL